MASAQGALHRPASLCSDAGRLSDCLQLSETEQQLGPPLVHDSNPDPGSLVRGVPVTTSLSSPSSGPAHLTLSIDPSWLADPARVFPVSLELPIRTVGSSSTESSVTGTLSSCAPSQPLVQTSLVVGQSGGCTEQGLLYFDLTPLHLPYALQSATLNLYTPDQSGPRVCWWRPMPQGRWTPCRPRRRRWWRPCRR